MTTDDARTRLLNAAGPIFAEKGYEAATVREICQKAGVNVASVNYYFGGKERLYVEALHEAHPAKLGAAAAPDWADGAPAATKLRQYIRAVLTHLLAAKEMSWQERLLVREIMDPTPWGKELLRERFQAAFQQLQRIIDEIVPPETPDYKRHQIGLSIVGQCVYYRSGRNVVPLIVGQEEFDAYYGIEQLAEHIAQVSLAALGLAPPLAPPAKPNDSSPPGLDRNAEHSASIAPQHGFEN